MELKVIWKWIMEIYKWEERLWRLIYMKKEKIRMDEVNRECIKYNYI